MFKDTKALVNKLADTASEPLHTFDNTIKENPDLVIPLAVIHVVPIALMIIGTTQVILGDDAAPRPTLRPAPRSQATDETDGASRTAN
mgnify:CR=1 FL=1